MVLISRILIFCPIFIAVFLTSLRGFSQVGRDFNEKEKLIANSQTGSSPFYFSVNESMPSLKVSGFDHPKETVIRNGLPNYFHKVKSGKAVTIAYIGGSITRAVDMYRMQSAKFIKDMYTKSQVKFINAGVAGSDTDLGVFRLFDHVLKFSPDLIFIEFAVNGGFMPGMEGIIRKIRKYNPEIDICLIYTVTSSQLRDYAYGGMPEGIGYLELLASHYQIPSIHMAMELSVLEREGKLIGKWSTADFENKIVFSKDGVHPLKESGNFYAASIARGMKKMRNINKSVKHSLPEPFLQNNWEDAEMYDPKCVASFSEEWECVETTSGALSQFADWFPYVMKSGKSEASFTIKFRGNIIGLFDIGGPESGELKVIVDGKEVKLKRRSGTRVLQATSLIGEKGDRINRFNYFCNDRYRGQYLFIDVGEGEHTVVFSISPTIPSKANILGENQLQDITRFPEKYNQSVIYVGKILIRGEVFKN